MASIHEYQPSAKEEDKPEETMTTKKITSGWKKSYSHETIKEPPHISLKCKNYKKKLSSIKA
ncbi:hypothetical protein G9A89_005482 [Geosiphon pyriformis]|nr:hypothetical protein G9A89_005482 [Geosiphon pyriformis]